MYIRYIIIIVPVLLLLSCKKDNPSYPPPTPAKDLAFNVTYQVDADRLAFDTLIYTTDAGFLYSVSSVRFYLSQISLIKKDSTRMEIMPYRYFDASDPGKNNFTVAGIPEGDYIGMVFNLGLDSAQNISFSLPALNENNAMEWPEPMGGGYHFLKLEGHYIDVSSFGFAMHLGTNQCLVKCNALYKPIHIDANGYGNALNIVMNLNEWFRNPELYDFNVDGNFSMGNMMAMQKLVKNGADVFRFKE